MKAMMLSCALAAGLAGPVCADTVGGELYDLTRDLCSQSIEGRFPPFDATDFATKIDAVSWERSEFCHCVGSGYAVEGDRELLSDIRAEIIKDDTYFSLNFTMFDHMTKCLPAVYEEGFGLDLGLNEADLAQDPFAGRAADVVDGDLVGFDELAVDDSDVFMCQAGLAGDVPMPGAAALAQSVALGSVDVDMLCGCAALEIAKQGPDLQDAIAQSQNPSVVYGSALVGAIETCL